LFFWGIAYFSSIVVHKKSLSPLTKGSPTIILHSTLVSGATNVAPELLNTA